MDLSASEREFLRNGKLSVADVLDARNKKYDVWRKEAKELGKELVLGAPCKKAGHRLRTRSNDCVICKPAALTHQRNRGSAAYVYIAGSMKAGFIKIGSTSLLPNERQKTLRSQRYAGHNDWELLFHTSTKHAARLEAETLQALASYRVELSYSEDGGLQKADEIRKCSFSQAYKVLSEQLKQNEYSNLVLTDRARLYEFKPIKSTNLALPREAEVSSPSILSPSPSVRSPAKVSWWKQLISWIKASKAG